VVWPMHTSLFRACTLPVQGTHTSRLPWLFWQQLIPSCFIFSAASCSFLHHLAFSLYIMHMISLHLIVTRLQAALFWSQPRYWLHYSHWIFVNTLKDNGSLTVPFRLRPSCIRSDVPHTVYLAFCLLLLVSCLAYSSNLKMKEVCSSKTFYCLWTTWCYASEDCILQLVLLLVLSKNHISAAFSLQIFALDHIHASAAYISMGI
jgi:hypothetical protein